MWWCVLTRPGVTRQSVASIVRGGRGRRVGAAADGLDQVVGDGHPAAGELAPLGVDRGDEAGVANEQIGHGVLRSGE